MTSSYTIAFSGTSSVLQSNFLPEIMLDENTDYSLALLDLIIKNSSNLDDIIKLNVIHVDCDIISGSYINGVRKHTIHQFATTPRVRGQTSFVEIPKNLNYFPVKTKILNSIQISILDPNGKPVNTFSGEIICRINIKRDNNRKSTA